MNRQSLAELEDSRKQHIRFWAIVCAVAVGLTSWYFAVNFSKYQKVAEAAAEGAEIRAELQDELVVSKSNFEKSNPEYQAFYRDAYSKLDNILPAESNYTELTRQLDNFEKQLARRHNPFEVSNISFQAEVEEKEYAVLPFRMNIKASRNNFVKFLHLIEGSGSLDGNVRLMDISSIRLNFIDGQEEIGGGEIINFSVQINAYFQK